MLSYCRSCEVQSDNGSLREMQGAIPMFNLLFLFYLRKAKKTENQSKKGKTKERTKEVMMRGMKARFEVRGELKQRVNTQESEISAKGADADPVGTESLKTVVKRRIKEKKER